MRPRGLVGGRVHDAQMLSPHSDTETLVRGSLGFLSLYAVTAACLTAIRNAEMDVTTRLLACVSAAALLDAGRLHPAVREIGLMLLRGGTVTALFIASAEYGPTPEQGRRAGQALLVATFLAVLVLLAQARRAAEARVERQELQATLTEVLTEARADRAVLAPVCAREPQRRWLGPAVVAGFAVGAWANRVRRDRRR